MTDVNPTIIKKTQDILGKYVKKPALSEKLLKKPPFRFIHDIVNVIIKDTGYLDDAFTVDELNYETIQDKDGKINFLQKLIDAVKKSSGGGDNIKVRPSKIVAGQEPERTNELLQAIGRSVDRKLAGDAGDNKKNEAKKKSEQIDQQKKSLVVEKKTSKSSVNKINKPSKLSDDNKVSIKPLVNKTPSASNLKKNSEPQKTSSKEKERSTNRSAIKSKDGKENGKKSATSGRILATTTPTPAEPISNGKIEEEPSNVHSNNVENPSSITEIVEMKNSSTVKSNGIDSIFGREENLNHDIQNGQFDELTNGIDENEQLGNHVDQITYPLSKPISAITKKSSASTFKNEKEHSGISNSQSAELVDIIDQEAELRRREKSEKSAEKRQHQKSSKSRENIEISEVELSSQPSEEPIPPTVTSEPIRQDNDGETSKPTSSKQISEKQHRTSSKRKNKASDEHTQPIVSLTSSLKEENVEESKSIEPVASKPPPVLTRARSSLRPPSVRPASARPGAPRRRDRNIEIVLKPEESLQMAGINVKVEPFRTDLLDDEGDNLIIIEDPMMINDQALLSSSSIGTTGGGSSIPTVTGGNNNDGIAGILGIKSADDRGDSLLNEALDDASKGHLVQQILETQKEFSKNDQDLDNKMDWDATTMRQQQSSAKQMDTLRESIQKLSRSINPLGKLMDFLQEDIDSMQMELKMWQNVYTNTKADLKHEAGLTENAVQPLKQQLIDIDANILEHIEMTNTCRLNILQNEEKILKLLSEI